MDNATRGVLEDFEEKKLLSYGDISRLYEEESVQGVKFFSDGTGYYITDVRLMNGENFSFP